MYINLITIDLCPGQNGGGVNPSGTLTISENGERGYQKIDKTHALQLNSIGSQFYSLPFKVVNSLAKALRWKHNLR